MEGIKEKRGHSAAEPQPQRASVGVSAYRCIGVSVYRRKDNNSPLSNLQNLTHDNLRKKNRIFTYGSTRHFPRPRWKKKILLQKNSRLKPVFWRPTSWSVELGHLHRRKGEKQRSCVC